MSRDTEAHDDESTGGSTDWSRRTVLKLSGASAGLAALGGTGVAAGQEEGETTSTPTDGEEGAPDDGGTVHEVRTLIGQSTNPERPADFFYQPTGLHVQPGDVVKFVFVTPDHNVVSYHPAFGMRRRVPTGVDAFSAPISGWTEGSIDDDQVEPPAEPGGEASGTPTGADDGGAGGDAPVPDTWLQAFETPGVYDLLCSPHETFGMAMRVVVGDQGSAPFETSDPEALAEPRAGPVGLARLTLTDPALEPSNVVAEGSVPWEALGANQAPETPTEG